MPDRFRFGRSPLRSIWLASFLVLSVPFLSLILLLPLLLPYPLLASFAVSLAIAGLVSFVAIRGIRGELSRSWLGLGLAIALTAFYLWGITAMVLQAQAEGLGFGSLVNRGVQTLRVQKSIRNRESLVGYDRDALTRNHAAIRLREFFAVPMGSDYRILNFRVRPFRDSEMSFLFEEIFVDESYYFASDTPRPLILDCGSNIGASVLYFKHLYPDARIVAFEPDPRTVAILKENVLANDLRDVQVIEKAVSNVEGTLNFNLSPSSLLSSGFRGEEEQVVEVATVRLSDFVNGPVDFLKLDIEGAEGLVIQDLVERKKLSSIKQMIVEWHHHAELSPMKLGEFLGLLEEHGFDYQLTAPAPDRFVPGAFQDVLIFAYQKSASSNRH